MRDKTGGPEELHVSKSLHGPPVGCSPWVGGGWHALKVLLKGVPKRQPPQPRASSISTSGSISSFTGRNPAYSEHRTIVNPASYGLGDSHGGQNIRARLARKRQEISGASARPQEYFRSTFRACHPPLDVRHYGRLQG